MFQLKSQSTFYSQLLVIDIAILLIEISDWLINEIIMIEGQKGGGGRGEHLTQWLHLINFYPSHNGYHTDHITSQI